MIQTRFRDIPFTELSKSPCFQTMPPFIQDQYRKHWDAQRRGMPLGLTARVDMDDMICRNKECGCGKNHFACNGPMFEEENGYTVCPCIAEIGD
jgi:hypothetical protein